MAISLSSRYAVAVAAAAPACACTVPHRLGGRADGGDDVLVARAAAVVALDRVADLVVGRIGVVGQQVGGRHDHARGAEAALEAVLLPEGGLERMQVVTGRHPFDRPDLASVRLDGQHRARLDGHAVHVDGAGTALAGVAADVGAGQVEVFAEGLDQETSRLHVQLPACPIDDERDVFAHGREPPATRAMTGSDGCAPGPLGSPTAGLGPPRRGNRWWHRGRPESSRRWTVASSALGRDRYDAGRRRVLALDHEGSSMGCRLPAPRVRRR